MEWKGMKVCKMNQVSKRAKKKKKSPLVLPWMLRNERKWHLSDITMGHSTVPLHFIAVTEFPATLRHEMVYTTSSKEKGWIWRSKGRSRKQPRPQSQPSHYGIRRTCGKAEPNTSLENTAVMGQNPGCKPHVQHADPFLWLFCWTASSRNQRSDCLDPASFGLTFSGIESWCSLPPLPA